MKIHHHEIHEFSQIRLRTSLHRIDRNADISSEYVQISVIATSYVVFGYMEASYQFWGLLRDGHGSQGEISRRL